MNRQTEKNLLKIVKDNYKEIAYEFSNTRKKCPESIWFNLIEFVKNIKNNDKILDVGCGNGRLLSILKDKKISYLGVDNSKKLINIAKKSKSQFFNRLDYEFRVGNVLGLGNIPEFNFDYVFLIAVVHHIPGIKLQVKALRQLKNKVSDNGKIIITVWNFWNNNSKKNFKKLILKFSILKLLKKNKMDWGDILFSGFNVNSKRYYHVFTKYGLKKIAKKADLKIEKIYKDKYNYYMILKK